MRGKYMSIASLLAYYTFTDYLAAVDQQAKEYAADVLP